MAVSWLALLLAELGKFSAWPCVAFGLLAAVAIFFWGCHRATERTSNLFGAIAIVIALATLVFTRQPGELILGGWDPGVYVHTAAHISRTGELLIRETDLNKLTPDELAILTRTTSGVIGPFTGMWMLPDGRLSPQFHHLYPSLMAVAFSFGGVKAALLVNPLLNVGCIIAMFALARRFVRAPFALAAAVLLALNPAQLWQAKFCTAEMLGQFLLVGGALFFLDALQGRGADRRSARSANEAVCATLAGAAFGLALLARYDSIIFIAPLFAMTIAAWAWLPNRRNAFIVIASFAPFMVHHVIHHHLFAPYYQPMSGLVLVAIAICVAGAFVFSVAMRFDAIRKVAEQKSRMLRIIASLAVLAWWGFVWARPHFPKASAMAGPDAGNFYFIAAMFGPLVALFAASLVAWIFSEKNPVRAIWLYASTTSLMVVTTSVFNDHFLMWVSRRFIPVAVPLLILAFVKLLDAIARRRSKILEDVANAPRSLRARKRLFAKREATVMALLFAVLMMNFRATRAMAMLRDWPGLADWTARVAAVIPDDARVFCDQKGFAAPLRFLFGKKTYELHLPESDKSRGEKLEAVMNAAAARGEKVFFLTMQARTDDRSVAAPSFVERDKFPLTSQKMENSERAVPLATKAAGGDFVLYEIRAR